MASDVVNSTYVFVARFEDGRRKDQIRFIIAESQRQAAVELPREWRDASVHVDSLGTFEDFYSLAPKLSYDFKSNATEALPDLLTRTVGEPNIETVVTVAGSSKKGWNEMPPRTVLGEDRLAITDVITDKYGDIDPVGSHERTLLTDTLLLFRERVRRIARNDAVNYAPILQDSMKKHGLSEEDRLVMSFFHRAEQNRKSMDDGEKIVYGVTLSKDGLPRNVDYYGVYSEGTEHTLTDATEKGYDCLIGFPKSPSRRCIVYHVLNQLNSLYFRSDGADYKWYIIDVSESNLDAEHVVCYARSQQHAYKRIRHVITRNSNIEDGLDLPPSSLNPIGEYTIEDQIDSTVQNELRESDNVIIDSEPDDTHIPDTIQQSISQQAQG